jgi:hypothetical protein
MEYHGINVEIWRRLQKGESLSDLDFAPPPSPPQTAANPDAGLLLGAIAFGVFMALAFNSRN